MADANNKVDLQLNIKTDYQAAGMDAATEATLRQAEAQKTAAEAAKAQAEAEKAQAQAAAKEADAEEELEIVMRLVTLGKKALQQEVQRLTKLRKEAAAAGDTEAYKKLTAQLTQTRAELKKVQQAKQLDKLVMFGQAQTAAQLAGQMKSLGDQLKSGSTDFAGMTMQVVNMGLAFKALAGPIGWVMLAIQGLQMAWEYYQGEQEKAAQKQAEEAKAAAEEAARLGEAFRELGRLGQSVTLSQVRKDIEDAGKAAAKTAADAEAAAQRRAQSEERAAELQKAQADNALELEKARIDTEVALGRMSAEQAAQARNRAETAHREALDRMAAEGDARAVKEAEVNAQIAEDYAAKMEASVAKLKPIAALKLPTADEYRQLEKRLELLDEDSDLAVYEAEKRGLEKVVQQAREMLKKAEIPFEGTEAELIKFVQDIRETVQAQTEAAAAKRDEARADRAAADAARQTAGAHEEERRLANETAAAQRESADAARRQAQANKDIADALNKLLDDTKTTGSYAPEEKRLKTAILSADKALLERRRDELAEMLTRTNDKDTRRSIEQQQKEVARQLQGLADAMAANTREAKGWLKEFAPPDLQARNKQAQFQVDRLNKQLAAQVKNAERAAKSGSPEAYDRAKDQIARTADALKKVSGRSTEVDTTLKEINDRLDGARGSAGDTQKAQGRAAKAADKLADETEKAADKVAEQKPAESARTAEQAAADMQQQVDELKGALAAFGEQQQGLQAAVQQLATAVQNLSGHVAEALQGAGKAADAAAAAAKAASAANKTLSANLNRAWGAIRDLQNGL